MGRRRLDPIIEGEIRGLLMAKWSERKIIEEMKKKSVVISRKTLYNIKNRPQLALVSTENQPKKKIKFKKLSNEEFKKLKNWTQNPNPKTQNEMARNLNCSQQNVSYHIKKNLNLKIKVKNSVHRLTENNVEQRRRRSLKLYKMLNNDQWKKYVTTDEAFFYVNDFNGQRKIHYVSRNMSSRKSTEFYTRKENFSPGLMVWAGISAKGKTKLYFIEPGAKINSDYYINNVLKKFLARDAPRLYPDGDFIFHQDSAPSHASKKTQEFLVGENIKFISKDDWMAKSPDAAPMDYYVWGVMKSKLKHKNIKDTAALKRAIIRAWNDLPQESIDNALRSWPKRCLKIRKNKGKHIE